MNYTPHTELDIQHMLTTIGAANVEQLFDEIPANLRDFTLADMPVGISEMHASLKSQTYAEQDQSLLNFIGAGAYEHFIPAAVWDLTSRGEFMTAYTPYQAEASQGTLQVIFEYQTMMSRLTGLAVSNASMYDGATALAEAVLMAVRALKNKKNRRILVPKNIHPHYIQVVKNLTHAQKIAIISVDYLTETGQVDATQLQQLAADETTALVIAQPNFFGGLEAVDQLTDWAHDQGSLVIGVTNPTSLALLKAPGSWGQNGADIVVGEGQPLGVPLSGGGPYFGFMCCQSSLIRQLPGRIVGQTTDSQGNRGFTLTLQTREQHIRRSKATSNICTNQGLAVTAATIYMSILGPLGLTRVAEHSINNTRLLINALSLEGIKPHFNNAYFHECLVDLPLATEDFINGMLEHGIDPGFAVTDLPNTLLICVTETKTQAMLDQYTQAAGQVITKFKSQNNNGGAQ